MGDERDYLDDFFIRSKPPENSETKRFIGIVVGRRPTPSGGIATSLAEVQAADKIMKERERHTRDESRRMGVENDYRWPMPFYNMDGTLDATRRRDGTVSPVTEQEEKDLREVFGVTVEEYVALMTRGPIK
jgi:hypothetical protein